MPRLTKKQTTPFLRLGLVVLLASRGHVYALSRLTSECPAGFRGRVDSVGFTECAVPLDDVSTSEDPATWAPWTHRPVCLISTTSSSVPRGPNGERLPGFPEPVEAEPVKYCVYTNVHIGDGGLSIITTPEHAASSLYLLENPNIRLRSRSSAGRANVSHSAASKDPPPYEVVDMPGKGKGVLATRRINRFEPIMLEFGAILTDTKFPTAIERVAGYKLLHEAVDRLPGSDRILTLAQSSPFAQNAVEDVLRTNSFAGELDGEPHMALFPGVSRINHACKPNAFTRFSRRSVLTAVVAARDIEPGEEITISYSSMGMPYEERQERLKTVWGFRCTCAHCSADEATRAASDARLLDARRKRKEVVEAIDRADAAAAVRLGFEILDLLATEDLPALFAEEYEVLARVFHLVRRDDMAAKYAAMALKILDLYGSLDPDDQYVNLDNMLRTFVRPRVPLGEPSAKGEEEAVKEPGP